MVKIWKYWDSSKLLLYLYYNDKSINCFCTKMCVVCASVEVKIWRYQDSSILLHYIFFAQFWRIPYINFDVHLIFLRISILKYLIKMLAIDWVLYYVSVSTGVFNILFGWVSVCVKLCISYRHSFFFKKFQLEGFLRTIGFLVCWYK